MKKINVLVIDQAEIREGLADFFMDLIKNDPQEVRRLILSQNNKENINSLIPNIGKMFDTDAVELYAELCLGVKLAQKEGVNTVYYENKSGDLLFLADAKQGENAMPTVENLKKDGGLAIIQKIAS